MNENIRKLLTEFTGKGEVRGFHFSQIKRGKQACLYEVACAGLIHYEVFELKVFREPKTNILYETYPKANSFGIWAWTYRNYTKALEKYAEIERVGPASKKRKISIPTDESSNKSSSGFLKSCLLDRKRNV